MSNEHVLDPALAPLLEGARAGLTLDDDQMTIRNRDDDASLIVSGAGADHQVSTGGRGREPYPVVRRATSAEVERYLAMKLGSWARDELGLDRIVLPSNLPCETSGLALLDVGDWWFRLVPVDAGPAEGALELQGSGVNDAIRFTYVAALPLDDLVASYLDPDGAPALQQFVRRT